MYCSTQVADLVTVPSFPESQKEADVAPESELAP